MFGIFVQYSTRPIYDVSMNLFCWPPSVDIFNILPGFLWQPLLNYIIENLSSRRSWGHGRQEGCARSGSSTACVARKAKSKQWMVFGKTRVMDVLSVFTLAIWNVFTHDVAFRISVRSLSLKGTSSTFCLPHAHMNISSFTFIRQAWNAVVYYLIV